MHVDNRLFDMAFSHIMGVGPLTYSKLVRHFTSSSAAYQAREHDLLQVLGPILTDVITTFRKKFDPYKKLQELSKANITVVTQTDLNYPPALLAISDAPICLYVKGNLGLFNFKKDFMFAVVGTRRSSVYGIDMTKKIAGGLTRSGMVIVSGMALGIDTAAHEACLDEGGRTIVVLGNGVDYIYPYQNADLYHRVVATGGIVLSEFPPGMLCQKGLFVVRNRIITGLSRGVLVVEGNERSGALISAKYAGDQGRDVFAVPGLATDVYARAPHFLIKTGAKIATCVNDILEEYNVRSVSPEAISILPNLPDAERQIYQILLRQPKNIDDLMSEVSAPVTTVLTTLSMLEIKGLVGKDHNAQYSARSPA